jgi:hypothetical protein
MSATVTWKCDICDKAIEHPIRDSARAELPKNWVESKTTDRGRMSAVCHNDDWRRLHFCCAQHEAAYKIAEGEGEEAAKTAFWKKIREHRLQARGAVDALAELGEKLAELGEKAG